MSEDEFARRLDMCKRWARQKRLDRLPRLDQALKMLDEDPQKLYESQKHPFSRGWEAWLAREDANLDNEDSQLGALDGTSTARIRKHNCGS